MLGALISALPVAGPLPVPALPPGVGQGVGAGQVHGARVAGAQLPLLLLVRAVQQQRAGVRVLSVGGHSHKLHNI